MFSCQKVELIEDQVKNPGKLFSALLSSAPKTKAMGDTPDADIKSMHLVIFDENGMLVETREATIGDAKDHGEHLYERYFEVLDNSLRG